MAARRWLCFSEHTNGTEDGLFDAPTREAERERVRDASDIVRIVGEHIALKPKGREFLGLCPFHDDHNESMHVVPHKQIFHCFSCDTGGDVYTFVQKFHRMTFPEALEYLAQRAGIELAPRQRASGEASGTSRRDLIAANEMARDFFRAILRHPEHGQRAREMIARRGISDEMVERFELGAAPRTEGWDGLLRKIQSTKGNQRHFIDAGLLKRRERDGSSYDAFRDRLMFPITNQAGQVVAFGGRRLDEEDKAKYLNSAETGVFEKSTILYGLSQAARSIQRDRLAVICEGYTDVIACHQAGLTNAIATLGTALTSEHADLLTRLDAKVVLLFDGDEAGEKAADRAVEVVFARPLDVGIVLLSKISDAKDPDELLKTEDGLKRLRAAIDSAPDVLEYRFARLRARLEGAGTAELERATTRELERLVELGLGQVPPMRRRLILRRLSEITGLPADMIAQQVPAGRRARRHAPHVKPSRRSLGVSEHLLGCVLCEGTLWSTLDEAGHALLDASAFVDEPTAELAALVRTIGAKGQAPDLSLVLATTEDEPVKGVAVALTRRVEEETEGVRDRLHEHWHDCLRRARHDKARAATLVEPSPDGGDLGKIEKLRALMAADGGDNRILPRTGHDTGSTER